MNTKFLTYILAMFLFWSAEAQIKTPASSPLAKAEYTVGLTTVNLEYYRPGKKGRTIYGDLVAYDQLWRTGANKNSMITFSDDVLIFNNIKGKVVKHSFEEVVIIPQGSFLGKFNNPLFFISENQPCGIFVNVLIHTLNFTFNEFFYRFF